MTETPPPRRALATFLRRAPARDNAGGETERTEATDPATAGPPIEPAEDASAEVGPADAGGVAVPDTGVDTAPAYGEAGSTYETAAETPEAAPVVETTDAVVALESDPDPQTAPTTATPAAVALDSAAWQAARLPIASAAATAPTFARPRARAAAPRTPAWQWLAMFALALLLALQILLADRVRLAADAQWRPLLATLCGVLRCDLPTWHEPAAFTMQDRDVRPASDGSGALRIQASFRNDARWSQAWPALQLSLSDADGRVIGSRVFSPTEYLGHPPGAQELLAPGQSARIDFRVREPAAGTAAFTFEFH